MNRLLWTLSLGVFAGALDLSVLSPALPALGRDFNVQIGDLAWVFTIYLLVTVLSITLSSTLADRYGRRPVYLACLALFAAGSVVAIAAPSYPVFLVARAIQALGAGGIFPVATATIGDVVPAQRRG
ncbi:MAG: MFS transporter, partial [Candidatus Cybelea sp.]